MLSKKIYTRQELIDIYKTPRIDAIKTRLTRDGYKYFTTGRGNDLQLYITELPPRFKCFCKEVLGFKPQTNFPALKKFMYRLFFDESFARLSYVDMSRKLEPEITISEQTISNWIDILQETNLIKISNAEFVYYSSHKNPDDTFTTRELTKEEYNKAWEVYWEDREDGYNLSASRMYNLINGTPHKHGIIMENALESEKLTELRNILNEEAD